MMFLDEAGSHDLSRIDKEEYPVFVVGGVIVDLAYARTVIEPRVRQLKQEFFGRDDIILHTADIIRAKKEFEVLKDEAFRAEFYEGLNTMMRELDYIVVACAFKKDEHLARYGRIAADPYRFGLQMLIERFCQEIGEVASGGVVYAEKRRPDLDRELETAWQQAKRTMFAISGVASYVSQEAINERIVDLILKDKHLNIAGLQLADLVVSPIWRHVVGKAPREDWSIVERKFRRSGDRYEGYGLIIWP